MQNATQDTLTDTTSRVYSAAKSNVDSVAGKLSEKAGEAAEMVKEGAETAKAQASSMVEAGKEYAEEIKGEVGQALSDATTVVVDSLSEQVRSKPVVAIGAALLAGMVLGNLLRK